MAQAFNKINAFVQDLGRKEIAGLPIPTKQQKPITLPRTSFMENLLA